MPIRIDPVCGCRVDQSTAGVQALLTQHEGGTYCFCSMQCKQEFARNPHAYAAPADPVCGKMLDREEAELRGFYADHEKKRHWFCSADCTMRFVLAPGFYSRLHHAEIDHPSDNDLGAQQT